MKETKTESRLRFLRWACIAVLIAAAVALGILRLRADTSVTVRLPNYPITIDGQQWDNRNAAYPLLTYRGVTYLPAPAAPALGLMVRRAPDTGLAVSPTGGSDKDYRPEKQAARNPRRSSAAVLTCPVTVAGEPYARADEPFLEYRGVAYLPLTETLCTGPLCLDYTWDDDAGLSLRTTGRLRAPTDALPHFILHTGGVTEDGKTATNSIEAAEHSYNAGYRWLEIDFNWTRDEELVCIHDWGNWWHRVGVTSEMPLSLADFERMEKSSIPFHSFTPALLDGWLKEHPGAMVVTDVKDDNALAMRWLAERYPGLRDRLIVQIYALDEYEPIRALGYENIILTMYRIPWEEFHDLERLTAFIRDSRILAVTMPAEDNVRDVFDALVSTGIPVFVHTLNDPEAQAQWIHDGAYGVYTDYGDVRTETE